MKDKIRYMLQWVMYRGYIILPTLYVMALLPFHSKMNFYMLVFYALLGYFIRCGYLAWKSHELEDDAVDFDFISKEYSDNQGKNFREYIKDMPYWERMHWIPVIIFLCLTCYVMIKGLQLLFIPSPTTNIFIYIFAGVITYTLFWLVLMISNRRNMIGFVIFYIVFDVMSAFSFNFVHFYDNVSRTQRRDADMKACRMYYDIQVNNVNHITEAATLDSINISVKQQQQETAINNYDSQIAKVQKRLDNNGFYNGRRADLRLLSGLQNKRNTLIGQSVYIDASLKAKAHLLDSLGRRLDDICIRYDDNSSSVNSKDVQEAKQQVKKMQRICEDLSNTHNLDSEFVVRNDTITYILRKIEAKEIDHFASLKNLFSAFLPDKEKDAQLRKEYCAEGGEALERFYDEEKSFENRLLYLSIALSSLIDLLPLLLGIFVSYTKRKEYNT